MGGISSIGSSIGRGIAKITNRKPAEWLGNKWNKDPEGTLALATVTSIILKDGIGCAMYVTQSLNNDKIPEKKRKFVAALDLTNGVLMIGAQIAMFFAMRKYSGPIFEKLFNKSFNKQAKANIISRVREEARIAEKAIPRKAVASENFDAVKKDALDLFKFVVDIAAATIVGKRVIVPLVATPLAKKVEGKMNKNADQKGDKQTVKEEMPTTKTEAKIEDKTEFQAQKLDIVASSDNSNLLAKFQK